MGNRFSSQINDAAQVWNHSAARAAKVEIRENVLTAIGEGAADVFEAFAGPGEMFRATWHRAKSYVGCDKEWFRDDRCVYVADNQRVMRALDLRRFNIFDLDAYGSPWEQAIIVAARRPVASGELIGLLLTEGSGLKLKQGGIPLAELAGLTGKLSGLARWQDDVIDRAINGMARRMKCSVERRWQAKGKTGAGMRYIGLVLSGL